MKKKRVKKNYEQKYSEYLNKQKKKYEKMNTSSEKIQKMDKNQRKKEMSGNLEKEDTQD